MGVAIVAGCVWCGACVAFRVRAGCFGRFENLDELAGGGVRGGSLGIAGVEEPGSFEGEKVGFGDGVDSFGFRPSCIKPGGGRRERVFFRGSRCGRINSGWLRPRCR